MTIVVDASVALKWFAAEVDSSQAHALVRDETLIAPDLVIAETLNAAWKAVRRGLMKEEQADFVDSLVGAFDELVPSAQLGRRALEIGLALDHPVYDGFYIALAERERIQLVTADSRLINKARKTRFGEIVRALTS